MLTLIKGGRVLDPGNLDGIIDILIEDGKVAGIIETANNMDRNGASEAEPDRTIDAEGKLVTPGLVDMHVHLRDPGHEYKETIQSGSMAAAAGGFTSICSMPNTSPVNDNRQVTEYILKKAALEGAVRVYPIGAISLGLKGESLCEYGDLKDAGAVAFSDDGRPVMNSLLMRRALEYAKGFGIPIISHCEDIDLADGGVMNEGVVATRMGLSGIPNAVESTMVIRDILLCELTEAPLHIAHVSTKESVQAIREAKSRGIPVTSETAPHYFTITDEIVKGYDTNAKMNPPLRSHGDREAIREGLADGTIDAIASDHAPHSTIEKDLEFDFAANGIIGLETSLSLSLKLVEEGILTITELIKKMSTNPSRIMGLENGLKIGNRADITIMDTDYEYIINTDMFKSLSRNTPFGGWEARGRAAATLVGGKVVYEAPTL